MTSDARENSVTASHTRAANQSRPVALAVLGMHRSGTSATTSLLPALGVGLGDDLIPGGPGENPLGYFEDRWAHEVSEDLLAVLGRRWDSLDLLPQGAWDTGPVRTAVLETSAALSRRLVGGQSWGFKNPRTARLLPFWQQCFARAEADARYLVVLRNPISVATSLAARDGFAPVKAHVLWLHHLCDAVLYTRNTTRACVDFDLLLQAPGATLDRVASELQLPEPDQEAVEQLVNANLRRDLRHSEFSAADLEIDPRVGELTQEAYEVLRRWASGRLGARSRKLDQTFREIRARLEAVAPMLAYLDEQDRRVTSLTTRAASASQAEDELAARLAQLGEEAAADKATLGRQADALRTQQKLQAAQREEIERRLQEQSETRDQLAAIQSQLTATSAERNQLERRRAELGEQLQATRDELVRFGSLLVERDHELRAATSELTAAQRALDANEAAARDLSRENEDVRQRLEAASREGKESRAALQRSTSELQTLRAAREEDGERLVALETAEARRAAENTELAARVAAHEHNAAAMDARLAAQRAEIETSAAATATAEGALVSTREELASAWEAAGQSEARRAALEAQWRVRDEQSIAWLHQHVAEHAGQIASLAEATSRTRAWRTARRLQRLFDRLRGREPADAILELARIAGALHNAALDERRDARFLLGSARDLDRTGREITSGRILRALRWVASWRYRPLWRTPPAGPLEGLVAEQRALLIFLERLAEAPFPTARPSAEPTPLEAAAHQTVTVVIPVHDGAEVTLECLESVFESSAETPFEVLVIDDASTDRQLVRSLRELESRGAITLVRLEENVGFPTAVNIGIALRPDGDVVLLNSDTLVHGDWIDRLRRAARADWNVATVTPFSNNAEICSHPVPCSPNATPSRDELARIDEQVSQVNRGLTLTIPTAVGFCMYIRRSAIRAVGVFDAETFGRGYGEENDFCMRARTQGLQHLLAADVYVAHRGGGSFGSDKQALVEQAQAQLAERYPGYHDEIRRFIDADPARWLRQRIDAAQLASKGGRFILVISHAAGGGTERHIEELSQQIRREGHRTATLRPGP